MTRSMRMKLCVVVLAVCLISAYTMKTLLSRDDPSAKKAETSFLSLENALKSYLDQYIPHNTEIEEHLSAMEALIGAYQIYIKDNPDHIEARRQLVDMFILTQQYDQAEIQWAEIIKYEPDNDALLNECGIFYSDHVYDPLKAASLFQKAIDVNPDIADYHANLGLIYFVGRHAVAKHFKWSLREIFTQMLMEYDAARKLDPKNFLHSRDFAQNFIMADTFGVTYDRKQAIQAWKDCLQCALTPEQFAYVYIQIARILLQTNEMEQARLYLQKALEYDRNNDTAEQLLKQLHKN